MHWFFKVWLFLGALILALVFILFIRPKFLSVEEVANSEKFGLITRNEHWSGVIRVTGDILAFPGTRIDVAPGTQILVSTQGDKFNFDKIPVHQKAGVNDSINTISGIRPGEPFLDEGQKISIRLNKFFALGTKEQPIIFESAAQNKSPYDFNKISINQGTLANTHLADYRRLEVDNVTIQDSTLSDVGECAVCINKQGLGQRTNNNASLIKNTFTHTLRDYIWVDGGSPLIAGNTFLPTKGNGVVIDPKRLGAPRIIGNEFQLPGESSVYFLTGDEKLGGIVSSNLFAAGDITIPCDSRVNISGNHIKSNLKFIKSGNCVGEYKVGLNYWEIASPEEVINSRIIGAEAKFKVVVDGVLSQPPSSIGKF